MTLNNEQIFNMRKKAVLSKKDQSSIGEWDKHILKLCNLINSRENYFSLSSCSGRASLIIAENRKGPGLFLWRSHERITLKELKEELDKIKNFDSKEYNGPARQRSAPPTATRTKKELNFKNFISNKSSSLSSQKQINFKCEPCALHVACKDFESAKKLLDYSIQKAGWKNSGMISSNRQFILQLVSSEKIQFPIMDKEKVLVDDNFLEVVVRDTNKILEKSWEKIKRLEKF